MYCHFILHITFGQLTIIFKLENDVRMTSKRNLFGKVAKTGLFRFWELVPRSVVLTSESLQTRLLNTDRDCYHLQNHFGNFD